MVIENINHIVLFGGTNLINKFAKIIKRRDIRCTVISVPRQLNEIVKKDKTLKECLGKQNIEYYEIDELDKFDKIYELVDVNTLGLGLGEAHPFSKKILELFNYRLFDFMTIRLPQYRGGAHFTWQILRGSKIGAWNIQQINEEMIPGVYDSGAIIYTHEYTIPLNARIPQDYFDISEIQACKTLKKFLDQIEKGEEFKETYPQENFSTYFPRLYTNIHGWINWQWNSCDIEQFICAFDAPYDGAKTIVNNQEVHLKNVFLDTTEGKFHPFMNGLIYKIFEEKIFVATIEGALIIKDVVNDKKELINKELRVGMRFYTPHKKLEEAQQYIAQYNAQGLV